ncbi:MULTISPECIES: hypothetical protein [Xanthomonas]|uniref:Uncharacterized protein n=1 Tax=Xanthomonas arboricola TaxID=56448 RepID=A0AB73GXA9_9XANT|nr:MULTISPECIES: hypothetical protein [Xanthomonas]MBB5670642.1 hypothetical protein [Xanthomonas arboricola]
MDNSVRVCIAKKKTAQKKCFFENVVAPLHAKGSDARHRTASLDPLDGTHRDEALKKKCKRVLTVKKSVIRFRPADVAAKESEQNRHQADTLVPDVHRSAIHGGVGSASLQKAAVAPITHPRRCSMRVFLYPSRRASPADGSRRRHAVAGFASTGRFTSIVH